MSDPDAVDRIEETDPERVEERLRRGGRKVVGVRVDREFWRQVKKAAIDAALTTENFVEEALREKMDRSSRSEVA